MRYRQVVRHRPLKSVFAGSNPATSVEAKAQHFVVDKTEMSKKQCFGIITTVQRYTCHISYVWTHLS